MLGWPLLRWLLLRWLAGCCFAGGCFASDRLGWVLALRSRAPESGLDGRIPRALWLRLLPRARRLGRARSRGWRTGGVRPLRPGSLRSKPQPTLPRQHLDGWRKTTAIFIRGFGIDGPSRPADARGRPPGRARGLTRTSDRGAGVPSRDGRCAAPAAAAFAAAGGGLRRGLGQTRVRDPGRTRSIGVPARAGRRRRALFITTRSACKRPVFRVKPGGPSSSWPRASTGLDGPSMPKPS